MILYKIMVIIPKRGSIIKKHKRTITDSKKNVSTFVSSKTEKVWFEILCPFTDTTGTRNYYKCLPS
jgi:hypothetical protein